MPDYVYFLENRLNAGQRKALSIVKEAARNAGMTVFLAGGAVRDLTTGSQVRDLDISVQGNALKLKKPIEKEGAVLWGEHEPSHTLYFWFPGSVRVEVSSARREMYPKPGKPVYEWAVIHDDLRRRDFTANAMAISLNEGSYGLLLDPLNGIADIEARQLRLVSNYGFLEDPSRLVRATRLASRLGWELEERTRTRYLNAKEEGVIQEISPYLKGYELEQVVHEEDGLRALRALEAEGWMEHLFPAWSSAKVDQAGYDKLHKVYVQLLMQGVNPDPSAAQVATLTAKMQPKDVSAFKKLLPCPGFVEQWEGLDEGAKKFAQELTGRQASTASATWKLFMSYSPEAVLWSAFTSKSPAVQAKFNNFFNVWPEQRNNVPAALMLEMRITPDLPEYPQLLQELFLQLIDGKLQTEGEMRAFLEPYSPPAPPPPVKISRSRSRKETKARRVEEDEEEEVDISGLPSLAAGEDGDEEEIEESDDEHEQIPPVPKAAAPRPVTPAKKTAAVPVAEAKAVAQASTPAKAPKAASKAPVKAAPPAAVAHPATTAAKAAKAGTPAKAAKTAQKKQAKVSIPGKAGKTAAKPKPPKTASKPQAKPATKKVTKPAKAVKPAKSAKAHKPAPKPARKKR